LADLAVLDDPAKIKVVVQGGRITVDRREGEAKQ
jgi:hypothetical protein